MRPGTASLLAGQGKATDFVMKPVKSVLVLLSRTKPGERVAQVPAEAG